ncbi:MAG: TonB-dependent receptor [Bacteroidales bacterium]|nr:TonB-dependent receptor [Bacteroidales bacterium]
MRKFKLLLFLFLIPLTLVAQERLISGTVVDEKGEILPGVNVIVKGTTNGAITNMEGVYQIKISDAENQTLVFRFIGYESREIKIGSNSQINVALNAEAIGLNEVVAVGYGTQKKATLTGAISSIKSEELIATKGQNVQNMLTGRLPGVRVVQKTSEPGDFSNQFDIRGFGSPLVVIDGVPRTDFVRMDPNEVESISVLKDASAAVYGVRAANGVVLITTKKGDKGAPKLSYSMYYGVQYPAEILKPVGAIDRMTLMNEKSMRSLNNPVLTYSEEEFEKYRNGTLTSTDWYDAVMRNYAPQQQHNLNMTGGSERVTYFVNLGYSDQGGFWKSNDLNYSRFNLRSNIEAKVTDRLTFSLKLNGIMDNREGAEADSWQVFKTLWRSVPNEPVYANGNSDYLQKPSADIDNPLAMTDASISGYKEQKNKIFQSTMELSYDIPGVKGLAAKGLFSYDARMSDNSTYNRMYSEYNYDSATDSYSEVKKNAPTSLDRYYGINEKILYQMSLNYKKVIAENHNLDALVLFEAAHSTGDNIHAKREFSLDFPYLFAGNALNQLGTANPDGIFEYASNGFVGKLNYDFRGKYLMEFSFRYDGSSKFEKDNQWGFFPGGSIGWRLSEEGFIKNNFSFIQNLKLRASYGEMGDDGALAYQFLSGYDYPASGYKQGQYPTGYVFDGVFTNSLGFRAAANPYITWFTVRTLNVGVDGDLWNGKLGFTMDYFEREREGLLANRLVSLPGTVGTQMPQENINSDFTNGFEVELRHRSKINEFRYNVSGQFSITRPKNLYREQAPFGNSYQNWRSNQNDRYKNIWFGYGDGGRYISYDDIANSNVFTSNATLPGDYKYKDWNNDGVIDDNDKHPIANKEIPLVNFGLNFSAEYKGFDLSMLFQGAAMSYVVMSSALRQPLLWDGNALEMFMDRWHPVDPTMDPFDPNNEWVSGEYSYGATTSEDDSQYAIQRGTYVRLKNIELGYTLPKSMLRRMKVDNVRFFVNGYNLLTFSGVEGVDPEKPDDLYGYMYPLNKTVNVGAKISF